MIFQNFLLHCVLGLGLSITIVSLVSLLTCFSLCSALHEVCCSMTILSLVSLLSCFTLCSALHEVISLIVTVISALSSME